MVWSGRHSALATAVTALAMLALPTAARGETVEEFCGPVATSRAMADLLSEPEGGFADWGRVVIGGGQGMLVLGREVAPSFPLTATIGRPVEFPLILQSRRHRAVDLRWTLDVRVSRLGFPERTVRSVERRIGRVSAKRPRFVRLPAIESPGAYSYWLTVRDREGKVRRRLTYSVAVLRDGVKVHLATFGDSFRVGDAVSARVENYGSQSAHYGAGSEFDRFENGAWVRQNFEALFGHRNVVPMIALGTAGGFAGHCQFMGFTVPPGMTPGRYRMVKEVSVGSDTFPIYAEFNVVP